MSTDVVDELAEPTGKTKTKSSVKNAVKAAKNADGKAKPGFVKATSKPVRTLATLLSLVSDKTRLSIVLNMASATSNVTDICKQLCNMSQPAVSHHLALLRHADVIEPTREGKSNFYSLTDKGKKLVKSVRGMLEE